MRKLLILITILCVANICRAQLKHNIKAIIIDSASHEPLEFTTIAVLNVKDSSLVSYTLTDAKGAFTLHNLKDNPPIRLLISHAGYNSLRIALKFTPTEILNLGTLTLSAKMLTEVTIKGEVVPITVKKDTIEFNAEAFKVRPNALVQDLLKKLPGMQVDRDGTLNFNGQSISKVKVDGKDFFATNYKIATQNLDADMISKVQVYDDRENDPDHLLPDNQLSKIINLKFKKEFTKSLFGKFEVGAGTQDRYEGSGTFIKTINDLQMSVIGNSNNLNGTNFTSPFVVPFQFGARSGIQQLTTVGVNISDNFGKKVKVNLTYNLNGTSNINNNSKNVQVFLHDTTITTNSANLNHNKGDNNSLNGSVEYNPDADTKWKYTPQFTYYTGSANSSSQSFTYNDFTPALTTEARSDNNQSNSISYQHNINYYHAFKRKGASLTIDNNISVNNGSGKDYSLDNLTSFVTGLASDTLNRLANTGNKTSNVSLDVTLNYPLSKTVTGSISLLDTYNGTGSNLFTYNQDFKTGLYDIFLQPQSNDLKRNLFSESLYPELIYRKKTTNISAGVNVLQQEINNRFGDNIADLNKNYTYLLPMLNISFGKYHIGYTETVQQPNISDLQPITIIYSPINSFTGNPNLQPVRRRNITARYNIFNSQTGFSDFINFQASQENNSITRQTIITPQGAQTSTPINGRGRYSFYFNNSTNLRFKKMGKWTFSETTSLNGGYGHNYYFVNGQPAFQDTYYGTFSQSFDVDWNDIFSIDPRYDIIPNITRYQLVSLPTQSFAKQQVNVPVKLQWPKHIIFDVNYSYTYNPQEAQGFSPKSNVLSVSVARLLQEKDKGEFRLTCYDILNQSVSSSHFAQSNTINDVQYQTLGRYFMLSYSYRFNKVTTKEKK